MGYLGVDFDKTLAVYESWEQHGREPGAPITEMVDRVRTWLAQGKEVRVITARVAPDHDDREFQYEMIRAWCRRFIGTDLPVQAHKCGRMHLLYDDRAVEIEPNTGRIVRDIKREWRSPLAAWLAQVAEEIELRDPEGDITMGMVVAAMEGHTEVHVNPPLRRSELMTRGVHAAAVGVIEEMFMEPDTQQYQLKVTDMPLGGPDLAVGDGLTFITPRDVPQ